MEFLRDFAPQSLLTENGYAMASTRKPICEGMAT
jgi:hypothetical protein|tara:strand:+ start:954 stop:1055 length:102 start_codon:yes stop_codon:yes gene_type:complete